jgi:ribose/xylose/arabinose/galactoside ABC-type transport system permease subunit
MGPDLDGPRTFSSQLGRFLARPEWSLVAAIVAVVVLTGLVDSQHHYWREPKISAVDILRQTAMLGIFALGAAIVIISGGIDLSSGSVIAFSGCTYAMILVLLAPVAMKTNQPIPVWILLVALAGTLLTGFLIGSLHAWLITVVGLPPFVATLATLVGLRSFARAMVESVTSRMQGTTSTQINIFDRKFRNFAESVPNKVILFLALAGLAWLFLSRTVVGRHLYALGGNENAARLSGIRTERLKWLAYSISAILSSIAGILYIGDLSVADPQTLGQGYELNAIAASVVGGCSLTGGLGTIPGTMLGALFLRIVIDGVAKVIKAGADVYEGMIVGSVVVVAVAFNQLRQAGVRRIRFFGGVLGLVMIFNLALMACSMSLLARRTRGESLTIGAVTMAVLILARWFLGRAEKTAEQTKL